MAHASTLLRDGAIYTRQSLGDLLGYGAMDDLQGDDLHFDSQTEGRLDHKLIRQQELACCPHAT